ncbi:bab71127-7a3c-4b5e-a230-4f387d9e332e [Thermothielavioides terrestris]|uniref:Bab71127-7a3c-4b5e-a230-4f387d9e332e n=1 Tax=Thermothielavioides terrestris TaxID=2587410 RepID=A0A446B998_9PEZI|nr:bab71127-7a3c-4b5e-a230-4f387d9e332e [Thermothielavioides terrestris]
MTQPPVITLDGRTGEGGGQLVRIACALAAVATQPVRITHHVTAIEYLKKATGAHVEGLFVGSDTLLFSPQSPPTSLTSRNIKITADSPAASTLLIFQAVFPFLLFAGNDKGEPIRLEISGGTNVSFSLSYEYLDEVLLPTLEDAFGIVVERKLLARGWSSGKQQRGAVKFVFTPLKPGETLKFQGDAAAYGGGESQPTVRDVTAIDVSIIVPAQLHEELAEELEDALLGMFDNAEVNFKKIEDSGADSRIYVFAVARAGKLRWGRDWLGASQNAKSKNSNRSKAGLSKTISRQLANDLYEEVTAGVVDEYLQDQLVVFQALAEGRTSFPRGEDRNRLERAMERLQLDDEEDLRKEKTDGPIGEGSDHTTTVRWVASQLLPSVAWYDRGIVCEGAGIKQ